MDPEKFLQSLFGCPVCDRLSNEDDPSKFMAAVEINDDEHLLLLSKFTMSRDHALRLKQDLDLALKESAALKERLFLTLRRTYPEVGGYDQVGFRDHEHKNYFVGWRCTHQSPA